LVPRSAIRGGRSPPDAGRQRALFLNRRGGRLSRRGASDIFTAIAANAGLDDKTTAHIGRHTFVNELIRGGEDLVPGRGDREHGERRGGHGGELGREDERHGGRLRRGPLPCAGLSR